MFTVQEFWSNIDQINPYRSLGELARASGIDYHRLTQQRSRGYMPKPEDLLRLSGATRKTIESLLTGRASKPIYSSRTERIANRCEYTATETQLFMVEQILGLPTEYTVTKKEAERHTSDSIA